MRTLHSLLGLPVLGIAFSLLACASDVSTTDATTDSTTSSSGASQGSTGSGGAAQGTTGSAGAGQGGTGQGPTGSAGAGQGGAGQGGAGQGGAGQGGQGGGQCAPGTNGCTDCLYMMCMNLYCDCSTSTDCTDIINCVQGCQPNDMQCIETCYMVNSTGLAEFILVTNCAGTQCQASCQGAMPANSCSVCLAGQCESQLEGCYADSECVILIDCIRSCPPGDMVCQQNCTTQHPSGVPEVQALRMCSGTSCSGVCN